MKAETLLDSVVFQLTPTRTRYDLVIIAHGKTEKVASGILDPFLAHLKTAKDQIAKGGYSIRLEPDPGTDAAWFTKDTVERFVRYVSTPEVLERVNTLESEILQINEAISIQGIDDLCSSNVEDRQNRWEVSTKGCKSDKNGDKQKVMVFSKNGRCRRLSTGSIRQEDNSRHQLLRALDCRKTLLRKEQRMAFARAAAAGFDTDHMENLILFAKTFGASRLLKACLRFVDLWKGKHTNGQWLEIAGAETVHFQSEFLSMKAPGIYSGGDWKQKQYTETWVTSTDTLTTESNEKDYNTVNSSLTFQQLNSDHTEDRRPNSDPRVPFPHHYHIQFKNPMFPQWMSDSPSTSQSYPIQGTSHYQSYPVIDSSFRSPYAPINDPELRIRTGFKGHSMENNGSNIGSKIWEMNSPHKMSQDQTRMVLEKSTCQESHEKIRSGKRRPPGVIRNKKHITSEGNDKSENDPQSTSDSESAEGEDFASNSQGRKHRNSSGSGNKNGGLAHTKTSNSVDKARIVDEQEGDGGNWQAFQKLLLRVQKESASPADRDMFSSEEVHARRRLDKNQTDPSIPLARNNGDTQELRTVGCDSVSRSKYQVNCKSEHDDFMICGLSREVRKRSSDPISENVYDKDSNLHRRSSNNVTDESLMIPCRASSYDELVRDKNTVIDMNSDFLFAHKESSDDFGMNRTEHSYEPHDSSIMPDRRLEKAHVSFDPAKDFDMLIPAQKGIKKGTKIQDYVSERAQGGLKGLRNERKSTAAERKGLEKRKVDQMTIKGKSSKLNPLADAKARAEKLRAFKADLQKAKKEKEEEGRKRLEYLKRERQKRIAARSSSTVVQLPSNALQTRAKPTIHSPPSCGNYKFTDTAPTSFSPVHKIANTGTNIVQSPFKPQQTRTLMTPKASPNSCKSSKFSDTSPVTSSPLLKLLRNSRNLSQTKRSPQSTCSLQDSPVQKPRRLYSSSSPIQKSPDSSKIVAQSTCNPQDTPMQKPRRIYSSSSPLKRSPDSSNLFAESTCNPQHRSAEKATRLYPSSHIGSKFSDMTPSSSSPLQKFHTRTTSASSIDSHKISNLNRLNGSSNLVTITSRQSASPIKKVINSPLEASAVHILTRRGSDPTGSNMCYASSVSSQTRNEMTKRSTSRESQVKYSPAISTSRESSGDVKKNPVNKVILDCRKGKTSPISGSKQEKKAKNVSSTLNIDEPVVEKSILILENKILSAPVIQASEVMLDDGVRPCEDVSMEKIELVPENSAPSRPLVPASGEVDDSSECKPAVELSSHQVVDIPKDDSKKFSVSTIAENTNQMPSARAIFIEKPASCDTSDIEEHVGTIGTERTEAHPCNSMDSILEDIHEMHEKPHTKASPKGFKELLKFRRKGQSPVSGELKAGTSAVEDCAVAKAPDNVPTLKDLISRDSQSGRTPRKVSRTFSLFAPCQSKTSQKKEKKAAA